MELFERSGHFPHLDEPERFTATLGDRIVSTEPAPPDDSFRPAIGRSGAPVR